MATRTDVIVVGAGLSGLTAAKVLSDSGLEVVVLEASDRIGGRLHSIQNESIGYLDLGGQYVGPTQDHVLKMAKELGVETEYIYSTGDCIRYRKDKVIKFSGALPVMSSAGDENDNEYLIRKTEELCDKVPLDEPWESESALEMDRITYEEWINRLIKSKEARDSAGLLLKLNMTAEPREVSLLWALWYTKSAGGVMCMNGIKEGAQEKRFVNGAQQLPLKLAEKLPGRVFTNKPVTKISQTESDICVYTDDGEQFKGKSVIIATAPTVQAKIIYEPQLPPLRNQLIQRTPQGSVIKTITYYSRPYWRERGLSGITFVEEEGPNFPVIATMDDSKEDPEHSALVGFIVGEQARLMSLLTKKERMMKVAKEYAKVFDIPEMATPTHYEDKNWSEEQWVGGGYTAIMGPGVLTSFGSVIRTPFGRIHFAGTESATKWSGYMDGAIQAGERAANEIIESLGASKGLRENHLSSKL